MAKCVFICMIHSATVYMVWRVFMCIAQRMPIFDMHGNAHTDIRCVHMPPRQNRACRQSMNISAQALSGACIRRQAQHDSHDCSRQRCPARTHVLSNFDGYDLADEPSKKFKDAIRTPSKTLMFYKKVDGVCCVVTAVGQQNKYKKMWVESAYFDDGTASKIAQKIEEITWSRHRIMPAETSKTSPLLFPLRIVYPKRLSKSTCLLAI